MKYIYSLFIAVLMHVFAFGQTSVTYSVANNTASTFSPYFDETDQITITFTVDESIYGVGTTHALYLWAWSVDNTGTSADCPTNGTWSTPNASNKLTYSSSSGNIGTYTFTMNTVKSFYGNRANPLSKIGFLVKATSPTSDAQKSQDIILNVGRFQFKTVTPANGTTNFVTAGSTVNFFTSTTLPATFEMYVNGTLFTSKTTASTFFSYNGYVVNQDSYVKIVAIAQDTTYGSKFVTMTENVTPTVPSVAIPAGIKQGINYDPADPTIAYLAIYAPLKQYIHVIGDFDTDSYICKNKYLMNRDTSNADLYWIKLTGLTSQKLYTFQYRTTAVTTGTVVKAADPFSPQVLSPDDDPYINYARTVYPNLPTYPTGQQYDVSVLQTGMPDYTWNVTNFAKPAKEKLNIYEISIRDFTSSYNSSTQREVFGSFDDVKAKIPYFKTLGINAIELMPIMEFDGNNSWGYNTDFHFALDKAYGTPDNFRSLIDTCHQNGIAVILDIALNHATGRAPIERLWANNTTDGGYGGVASTNPYFNVNATHTYGVFYDLNHSSSATQYYVQRVVEQWITKYKVDGFRWDLAKGFTQNCSSSDSACTDSYQADRVAVLEKYADYQWAVDPTSYVILEYLGDTASQQAWSGYKNGIMVWNKMTSPYSQNTMGWNTNSDIGGTNFSTNYNIPTLVNYGESHDEERLMYSNLAFGNTSGTSVKVLANALQRMKAFGAVFLTIPGPKMIWQFGELGYDKSITQCDDGKGWLTATYNTSCNVDPKPSAFYLGYDTDTSRTAIYNTWAKILGLRNNYPVFTNYNNKSSSTAGYSVSSGDLLPRLYIWDNSIPSNQARNVVIFANFTTSSATITPYFPYTGTWYNMMDGTTLSVTSTTQTYTLAPGDFRIFANSLAGALLGTQENSAAKSSTTLAISPNPIENGVANVKYTSAKGGQLFFYDMSGKLLKTSKVSMDNGEESISVSGLKSGVYLVQLKSDKGNASTKVIVK